MSYSEFAASAPAGFPVDVLCLKRNDLPTTLSLLADEAKEDFSLSWTFIFCFCFAGVLFGLSSTPISENERKYLFDYQKGKNGIIVLIMIFLSHWDSNRFINSRNLIFTVAQSILYSSYMTEISFQTKVINYQFQSSWFFFLIKILKVMYAS